MKYRQLAGIFAILCILLYFAYMYWGLSSPVVLGLSIVSGIATVLCVVMMFVRPEKRGTDRGASSNT